MHRRQEPTKRGEARLLLGELAGDEGHAEQLPVRVLERGPGLPAGVDDRLGVAEVGLRRVLLQPVAQRRHDELHLFLAELAEGGVVLGGEDEDLVDAPGRGLGEHRAPVGHDEGLVPLEGGVEVRHHPDQPVAGRPVGLERRRRVLLVAGAERAGAPERIELGRARDERVRAPGAPGAHDDPPPGERIEPQLVHRCSRSGAGSAVFRTILIFFPSPLRYRLCRPRRQHFTLPSQVPTDATGFPDAAARCRSGKMAPVHPQPSGAAFDVVLLLHVGCVVAGLVTTATAAATATRLRRLVGTGAPLPETLSRYFRPGRELGRPLRVGDPGLRLRVGGHEPGVPTPSRTAGC